jgi:hypothetical protein
MWFPLLVAFVSVALGAGLAFATHGDGRAKAIRWIRLASVVAAVAVVAIHLVPEAVAMLGAHALAAFGAGIVLPTLLEAAIASVARRRAHVHGHHGALAALEIGYAGLVAHRFGDGLTMGAYVRANSSFSAAAWVVLALAAHIVPVTTVMILAVLSLRGQRSAWYRTGVLAASTMAGVVAATLALPIGTHGSLSGWISATVAGLLLHIVLHDIPKHEPEAVG